MAAPTFAQLKDEYARLWSTMVVRADKVSVLDRIAAKLIAGKPRYATVANKTGVPWVAIALIHQMESGQDWSANIAQGDPWNQVSTHVPRGRGPFTSWEAAAIDALSIDKLDQVKDWGIERLCYELELYNGFGSRARGIHTPYLWSYSNHYTRGKYIADHVWDADAVSGQAGAMPILIRMMGQDSSISFGSAPKPAAVVPIVAPSAPPAVPATPAAPTPTGWAAMLAALASIFKPKG